MNAPKNSRSTREATGSREETKEGNEVMQAEAGFKFVDEKGVLEGNCVHEDAGVLEDAGVQEDAGVHEDTGVHEDAGVHEDTDVLEDTGVHEDTDVRSLGSSQAHHLRPKIPHFLSFLLSLWANMSKNVSR